jgi:hypothetical protein
MIDLGLPSHEGCRLPLMIGLLPLAIPLGMHIDRPPEVFGVDIVAAAVTIVGGVKRLALGLGLAGEFGQPNVLRPP